MPTNFTPPPIHPPAVGVGRAQRDASTTACTCAWCATGDVGMHVLIITHALDLHTTSPTSNHMHVCAACAAGDGQLDWACRDGNGRRGTLLSRQGCAEAWPNAPSSSCPAAFATTGELRWRWERFQVERTGMGGGSSSGLGRWAGLGGRGTRGWLPGLIVVRAGSTPGGPTTASEVPVHHIGWSNLSASHQPPSFLPATSHKSSSLCHCTSPPPHLPAPCIFFPAAVMCRMCSTLMFALCCCASQPRPPFPPPTLARATGRRWPCTTGSAR